MRSTAALEASQKPVLYTPVLSRRVLADKGADNVPVSYTVLDIQPPPPPLRTAVISEVSHSKWRKSKASISVLLLAT